MSVSAILAVDYHYPVSACRLSDDDNAIESDPKVLGAPYGIIIGFVLATPLWAAIGWAGYALAF